MLEKSLKLRFRRRKKSSYFRVVKLKKNRSHLTLSQRYEIAILNEQNLPKPVIAERIGKNTSTTYRELRRNSEGRSRFIQGRTSSKEV